MYPALQDHMGGTCETRMVSMFAWVDWTNEKLFIKKGTLPEEQVRSGTASQESILSFSN